MVRLEPGQVWLLHLPVAQVVTIDALHETQVDQGSDKLLHFDFGPVLDFQQLPHLAQSATGLQVMNHAATDFGQGYKFARFDTSHDDLVTIFDQAEGAQGDATVGIEADSRCLACVKKVGHGIVLSSSLPQQFQ